MGLPAATPAWPRRPGGRGAELRRVLLLGLLTRPVALVAFLFLTSLWVSEWGTAWIWELLVPVIVH